VVRNWIKVTLRSIWRHKGYTSINVIGLAAGLTCCALISLWILDQLSYDKHYADVDRIHAILANDEEITPNALAPYLETQVSDIQCAARVYGKRDILVSSKSLQSYEEYTVVDPSIVDVFSFSFADGNPETALSTTNSIIITEAMTSRFFPSGDAVGNTVSFDNQLDLTIGGVVMNMPHNSSLQFDILVSTEYERQRYADLPGYYDAWKGWGSRTYVKVHPGVTAETLTHQISDMIQDRFEQDTPARLSAIHISDLHLRFSDAKTGVMIFSAIALAILALACINFINLSTARYKARGKETGIRKVVGAPRHNLIMRFLGESLILTLIGLLFALILVELLVPYLNSLFQLHLSLGLFKDPWIIAAIAGIVLFTALASGLYPAIALSRFHPVQTLKNSFGASHKKFGLRRILVVFQFVLTLALILGTTIMYAQIDYIRNCSVGYNKDHVVNIPLREDSRDQYPVLRSELLKNPETLSVTGSVKSLPYWNVFTTATWEGMPSPDGQSVAMNFTDYDFIQTYGIRLKEGRDFGRDFPADRKHACVVNEKFARLINRTPILGSSINVWGEDRTIIGVVEDFNFQSLSEPLEPLAIMMVANDDFVFDKVRVLTARISPQDVGLTMAYLRETWERILPNHPFEYSFLDDQFNAEYKSTEMIKNLAGSFGILAILVACLGLFGLASFMAEQRTKEIGIRKVLGASVLNIVRMISREFIVLVAISNVVAWPLTWLAMNSWLDEFAYRTNIKVELFLIVGICVLVVALLSVSYQAISAACANPVQAMRYE